MGNIDMTTKANSQFENVIFSQLQPARGPFRALMLWARASDGVTLPRGDVLPAEALELVALVREGKPANAAIVDVALGKVKSDSSLGGDFAKLKAQVEAFYATIEMSDATDLPRLAEVVRQFQAGLQEPDEVLETLVTVLPAPTRLVHPRSYETAYRIVEGVTLVLYLRRAITRLIATQDGITTRLGNRSERQYERQNVVFLGQLELACAVADDELRRLADSEGIDPVAVSAALVKAFAERSRRMGHPLAVREVPLGAGMIRDAIALSNGLPRQATSVKTSLDEAFGGLGQGFNRAGSGMGRLLAAAGPLLLQRLWAWLKTRQGATVALFVMALLALAVVFVSLFLAVRSLPAADNRVVSTLGGQPSAVSGLPLTQVAVSLRTAGPVTLEDVAKYFGLNSDQAIHFLLRYNATTLSRLDKRLIQGDLYSRPLPAGTMLYIPTVMEPVTRSLETLAAEYDTTVEGIRHMNTGPRKPYVLVPAGRTDKLPERKQETEPVEFRVGQAQFQPGKLLD